MTKALVQSGEESKRTFGTTADAFLAELYASVGAKNVEHKLRLLKITLGGDFNFYAMGGNVTDEMRLACLEYEVLERNNLIDLQLS